MMMMMDGMMALIMAGGRGSRLAMKNEEKPLVKINGKPMISYVIDALLRSKCFNTVTVALSRNTLRTRRYLMDEYADHDAGYGDVAIGKCYGNCKIRLVDTPAHGYVLDLNSLILDCRDSDDRHGYYNIFITPADLPLIDEHTVRYIVGMATSRRYNSAWIAVMTKKALLDSLGISCNECIDYNGSMLCYTGISIVDTRGIRMVPAVIDEDHIILDDIRVAVNVNTLEDLKVAERMLRRMM